MKVFLDVKTIPRLPNIISIGLVSSKGDHFYAELNDFGDFKNSAITDLLFDPPPPDQDEYFTWGRNGNSVHVRGDSKTISTYIDDWFQDIQGGPLSWVDYGDTPIGRITSPSIELWTYSGVKERKALRDMMELAGLRIPECVKSMFYTVTDALPSLLLTDGSEIPSFKRRESFVKLNIAPEGYLTGTSLGSAFLTALTHNKLLEKYGSRECIKTSQVWKLTSRALAAFEVIKDIRRLEQEDATTMPTKIYFDTEFTGLHQGTSLISIGLVAENGKTFYAEFDDYNEAQVDDWIANNVIANLNNPPNNTAGNDWVMTGGTAQVKQELEFWLNQFDAVQLVSDVCHYDMVLFIAIFGGSAFDIPANVSPVCYDINQDIAKHQGISHKKAFNINREEFSGMSKEDTGNSLKHNALWDACVIKACFERIEASVS